MPRGEAVGRPSNYTTAAAQFTTSKIIPQTNEQTREKQHAGEFAGFWSKLQDMNV